MNFAAGHGYREDMLYFIPQGDGFVEWPKKKRIIDFSWAFSNWQIRIPVYGITTAPLL